jgi:hypothetical protein
MPRNTERRVYISVAVNKDSDLMRQLEKDEERKGTSKSSLLVYYADEYVRLFLQGGMVPAIIPNPASSPASTVETPQPMITSELTDDELLDAFGD